MKNVRYITAGVWPIKKTIRNINKGVWSSSWSGVAPLVLINDLSRCTETILLYSR